MRFLEKNVLLQGISGGIQRSLMRVSQERFVKPAVPPQATPPSHNNPASPASNPRSSSGASSPMDTSTGRV